MLTLRAGYKTENFWIGYPHEEMTLGLKLYYLLQAAYWCQQTIILALKIEKPRKDFTELVLHVSGDEQPCVVGGPSADLSLPTAHRHAVARRMELLPFGKSYSVDI